MNKSIFFYDRVLYMFSQTTIYALRAIGYIASQDESKMVLAKAISEKMDIPKNFLSKILHKLVQKGFIDSIRGIGGGFRLAKPAKEIFLKQIVELFMNLNHFHNCFLGIHSCHRCGIHKKWNKISEQIISLLEESTVDQIFSDIEEILVCNSTENCCNNNVKIQEQKL